MKMPPPSVLGQRPAHRQFHAPVVPRRGMSAVEKRSSGVLSAHVVRRLRFDRRVKCQPESDISPVPGFSTDSCLVRLVSGGTHITPSFHSTLASSVISRLTGEVRHSSRWLAALLLLLAFSAAIPRYVISIAGLTINAERVVLPIVTLGFCAMLFRNRAACQGMEPTKFPQGHKVLVGTSASCGRWHGVTQMEPAPGGWYGLRRMRQSGQAGRRPACPLCRIHQAA